MERIPGGKARGGRCPRGVAATQIARGIRVEMEHTTSRRTAREIACDHLTEDPRYYSKLAKVHLDGPRAAISRRPRSRTSFGGSGLPEANVYINNIPKGTKIVETKTGFIAKLKSGDATVNWEGRFGRKSQLALRKAARSKTGWKLVRFTTADEE